MSEEEKPIVKPSQPQFIPKLKGKKVMIRLLSGGQPVVGTVESFNSYEIQLQTTKGELLVFWSWISYELNDSTVPTT
nr:hypothetical protein [Methanothrix sp.]